MLQINEQICIEDTEISMTAIRSMGSGGQNVNKVSSAIHLRFDVNASSLPDKYKHRLLSLSDSRITKEGVIVLKAQTHRTQEKNKEEALHRLRALIASVIAERKIRKKTRPSLNAKKRRLDTKKRHAINKALRKKVDF